MQGKKHAFTYCISLGLCTSSCACVPWYKVSFSPWALHSVQTCVVWQNVLAYLRMLIYMCSLSCSCSLTCFLQDYFSRFLLTFSDSSTCGVTVKWGERGDGPEIEIETRATCSRDWAWIYIWLRVYLGSGRIKQLHGNIGLFPIIAAVTGFTNQFLLPMAFSQRKHKLNQKKVQRKCVDVYSFCFHPLSSTLFTSDTLLHTQFHSVSTTIDCWAAGGLRLCCSEHQW